MNRAAPLLSVIIPIHNLIESGVSLAKAPWLNSWPPAPRDDVQFLIVDDASTDASIEVVSAAVSAGGPVEVVALESRGGPGAARNAGLARAAGTFVSFLDGDDQFDLEALLKACALAEADGLDLVALGYETCVESGNCWITRPTTSDGFGDLLQRRAAIWRFVFRRSFVVRTGFAFPGLAYAEDLLFMLDVAAANPRLGVLPDCAYRYQMHRHGLSGPSPKPSDARRAIDELVRFRQDAVSRELKLLADFWCLRIYRRIARHVRPGDGPTLLRAVAAVLLTPRCWAWLSHATQAKTPAGGTP